MTGMTRSEGATPPVILAVKVDALTTSRVVTPKSFLGLKTLWDLRTSATMGTVELTGLEITRTKALGQDDAIPFARSRTIPALILNKSIVSTEQREDDHLESCQAKIRRHFQRKYLSGDAGGDDDDICTFQGSAQTIIRRQVSLDDRLGIDMTQVCGNTG
jgi:hypothetical protein